MPKSKSIIERFLAKLERRGGCLEWRGSIRNSGGYGEMRLSGKRVMTHRLMWALIRGPIPDGLCVLHRCDNPACCEPDHLFLGTNADNIADKVAKGRQARGARMAEAARRGHAGRTPEQRSETARKREAAKTPEQRSASARKREAAMTSEQRSEIARRREAAKRAQRLSAQGHNAPL